MQDEEYIRVPLGGRYRDKPTTQWALIDKADEALTAWRWCSNGSGYAIRHVARGDGTHRVQRMSRQILGLAPGDPRQVDHINGNRLDNRRANLRVVTNAQNAQNMAAHSDAKSQYRGVDWFKPRGKWRARACVNGKTHDLGYFTDELEAAEAARLFRETHMTHNVEDRH